jgi:hypothetical protein
VSNVTVAQQLVCAEQPLDWQTHVKSRLDATYHLDLDATTPHANSRARSQSITTCAKVAQNHLDGAIALHRVSVSCKQQHAKLRCSSSNPTEFWGAAKRNRWRISNRQKSPWLDASGPLRACISRPNQDAHRPRTIDLAFHQPPTRSMMQPFHRTKQTGSAKHRGSNAQKYLGITLMQQFHCTKLQTIIAEAHIYEAERTWGGECWVRRGWR